MTEITKRFFSLLKYDNTSSGDVERQQLFYVIARTNQLWERAELIYDFHTHRLKENWDNLFDGTPGKMLARAAHLYNSCNKDISTVQLFWGMDYYNTQTMIDAQMIYCQKFDFNQLK